MSREDAGVGPEVEQAPSSSSRGRTRGSKVPVIVVGTGFGGAVAACRLAQAGYDVLVLERGRRYTQHDFPALPVAPALLPDLERWTWQPSQGLWDILDMDELVSVQAAGYGGGSLIYANVQLRPPDEVFDHRWPEVYRDPSTLTPFYDLAAYMLEAKPVTENPAIHSNLVKAEQLSATMGKLGRQGEFFYPPIAVNARQKRGLNVHGEELPNLNAALQGKCTGCGKCCTGCPEGAKNTLDHNYLAIAEHFGAKVRTQCEVLDVRYGPNGGFHLQVVDHLRGAREELETPYLFLCAGSVHTTRLLLRNEDHPEQPKSLVGTGYFPGGDALGVIYDTKSPQYPSYGPTITTTTVHWQSVSPSRFFQVQDGGYAAELERLIGLMRAPLWIGKNRIVGTGESTVPPNPVTPPVVRPDGSVPALPSPVDGLIAAGKAGDFGRLVSKQLRDAYTPFLEELRTPLLFPAVVGRTIEDSILDADRRWFGFLKEDGAVRRWLRNLARRFVRCAFGADDAIALRATRALLTQGGLDAASVARDILGYDDRNADARVMLLAMGRDAVPGQLIYDTARDRVVADLHLFQLVPTYAEEELLMGDIARTLGGELRTNPAWAFLGKPITVHNQGGCPMSDERRPDEKYRRGVLDPNGQSWDMPGLYVLDGAAFCSSVGVNPSATILAIAERNIERFIEAHPPFYLDPDGWKSYQRQRAASVRYAALAAQKGWQRTPPKPASPDRVAPPFASKPLGLHFRETMQGYYEPDQHAAGYHDAVYREHETRGRPDYPMRMKLSMTVRNLAAFYEDVYHRMEVGGAISMRFPGDPPLEKDVWHPVEGEFELFTPLSKAYGITEDQDERLEVQAWRTGYEPVPRVPPRERFMKYRFAIKGRPGYYLRGYKRIRENPAIDAWRDTSSLFVTLLGPKGGKSAQSVPCGAGVVHVDLPTFLYEQIPSITVGYAGDGPTDAFRPTDDGSVAMWSIAKFSTFFFGTLQRIYMPDLTNVVASVFQGHPHRERYEPGRLPVYPAKARRSSR